MEKRSGDVGRSGDDKGEVWSGMKRRRGGEDVGACGE